MHLQSFLLHQTSTISTDDELLKWKIGTDLVGGSMNKSGVEELRLYVESKERGVQEHRPRAAVLDQRDEGDEWIPIRPAADSAVSLGMINVLMNELKVWDTEFSQETNKPPLLDWRRRELSPCQRPLVDDPVIKTKIRTAADLDPKDNAAKPWNDKTFRDYALEGEFDVGESRRNRVSGDEGSREAVHARMGRENLGCAGSHYPTDCQRVCGGRPDWHTITIDGAILPYRPAIADVLGSRNHQNSSNERQAHAVLNLLSATTVSPADS